MRLIVKKGEQAIGQYQFREGPVYIGRLTNCQVLLPERTVSRQHAVLFKTEEGKWMVEDLDSANQTYLNGESIHKAEVNTGDLINIADFSIDIEIEAETEEEIQDDEQAARLGIETALELRVDHIRRPADHGDAPVEDAGECSKDSISGVKDDPVDVQNRAAGVHLRRKHRQ